MFRLVQSSLLHCKCFDPASKLSSSFSRVKLDSRNICFLSSPSSPLSSSSSSLSPSSYRSDYFRVRASSDASSFPVGQWVKPMSGFSVSNGVYTVGKSTNIQWQESKVTKEHREKLMGQKGCVVWMTGLSGSGKSTLAYTLDHALASMGKLCYVLDGDNVRHGLNKNLGFSQCDREENIRRVSEVAKLFSEAGLITIVSFISPYRNDRRKARELMKDGEFIEVYLKIPLSVCEKRDPKGLYKLARQGKIKCFTGIDDPYEEPTNAEIVLEVAKEDGIMQSPESMAETLIEYLANKGLLFPNLCT